jgi:MFS family permease
MRDSGLGGNGATGQGAGNTSKLNVMSKELFLSLYLPAIAISLGEGIATPVLPVYAKSFGISFETATLVVILNGIGAWLATVPIGYMVDRFGRRPVLLAGPLLMAATAIMTAFAPTFGILLVCRFFNGTAQQMWQLSRLAMITDTGKDRERGRMITWMSQVSTFSGLFSPAVGGFIATYWGIRVPFFFHAAMCILAIIPSFRLAKETDPERTRAASQGREKEKVPWREVFRGMANPQMLAFFTAQFMANFTRGVNRGGLLNLYAAYQYGAGAQTIGLMASANSFLQLPLGFTTGYIMDKWGRKQTIVPGFSLLFLAMIFMTATAYFQMPFTIFVAAYLCVTFSQGITGGNMQVMGSDLAPARGRGQWIAVWRFVAETGNQLSPTVFALVGAAFGYVGAFSIVGFSSLSVALLVGLLIRETVGSDRGWHPEHAGQLATAATNGEADKPALRPAVGAGEPAKPAAVPTHGDR